ncbi:MAG: flavodoxin family protein [Oscillospiraceae bacterium]|nr:flavodoxin family protein [Oscillospiraceae bacterium]
MKVLLVNGSPRPKGDTFRALSVVEQSLLERGVETEWFQIGPDPVRPCIDCRRCQSDSRCVFRDDKCYELTEAILRCDGVVVGTPTYFAGPNGSLCALLDRVFYSASDNGRLMDGKPAAGVAVCWRSGTTAALDRLNKYFTFSGMPVVGSVYWNNVLRGEEGFESDSFGIETLKELGCRMAELVKKLAR